MRIFDIFRTKKKALSNFGTWQEMFSSRSSAGVTVTNKTALNLSTVYACIRNISEDVSKVPLKVYLKTPDSKEVQPDHPLNKILNKQPNPDMTAMDFRQTMTAHCLGWGNAYAVFITTTIGIC